MLDQSLISNYNKSRRFTDKSLICHAPFVNLNFEQNGNITACCYNRRDVLGKYPNAKIMDAWTSVAANDLRNNISLNKLEGGCSICHELILAGNYTGTKSKTYDEYANPKWFNKVIGKSNHDAVVLPKVFEFELSNTCNLECTMCNGYFSSTIRKNREKLLPLNMIYDAAFIEDVSTFIPTLTDMKFLGGEPFLIDIYYDIWDKIIEINPNVKVHITTNATILNYRAKQLLEKLNVGIILSIDSLHKETYEAIRIGANFDRMMENLFYFKKITQQKNTYLSIAACPMITNWQDLPQLLLFCNEHNIYLHFNVVWSPEELSIQSLSVEKIKEIILFLEQEIPSSAVFNRFERKNKRVYTDLIETLKYWLVEKEINNEKHPFNLDSFNFLQDKEYRFELKNKDELFKEMLNGILYFTVNDKTNASIINKTNIALISEFKNNKEFLLDLKNKNETIHFNKVFLEVLTFLQQKLHQTTTTTTTSDFIVKINKITEVLATSKKQEEIALNFTETLPFTQINNIEKNSVDTLLKILNAKYF